MDVLSVVPIFMSAGAAVLPSLLAAATTVAAVIFKPRELLRLCRERTGVVVASAGGLVVCIGVATWWFSAPAVARTVRAAGPPGIQMAQYDWAKVAENIIALEAGGKVPTTPAAEGNADLDMPLVLGRDFSRAGYDGGPTPIELRTLWSFRPDSTMFLSASAIRGKQVYAAGCTQDVGGFVGMLACLDADTGKPLWQISQAGDDPLKPFYSSPALTRDGKSLIVGQGLHDDHDCSLLCFDTSTHQLRWAVSTPLHIESSPAIFGDIAVVGAGAIEGKDGKAVGDPGYVFAVSISQGKELWRQPVNDPESPPAIDEQGTVYIGSGFNGNALVAIRSAPDAELREKSLERVAWRTPLPLPVTSGITLLGDKIISGAGNGDFVYSNPHPEGMAFALDRKTGAILWQTKFDDAVLGEIAARDGKLICTSRSGEIAMLDSADGRVLWRVKPRPGVPILAGGAFTGKRIFAVSSDGFLLVLDPADGALLQRIYLNAQGSPGSKLSLSAPQVVGGRLFVGSETGGMQCYEGARTLP